MAYLCEEAEQWMCQSGLNIHVGHGQLCGIVILVNGNLLLQVSSKSIAYPVFKVDADSPFFS